MVSHDLQGDTVEKTRVDFGTKRSRKKDASVFLFNLLTLLPRSPHPPITASVPLLHRQTVDRVTAGITCQPSGVLPLANRLMSGEESPNLPEMYSAPSSSFISNWVMSELARWMTAMLICRKWREWLWLHVWIAFNNTLSCWCECCWGSYVPLCWTYSTPCLKTACGRFPFFKVPPQYSFECSRWSFNNRVFSQN